MEEQMRDIFLVLIHDITEEIKKDDVETSSSPKITKIVQKMDKTFEENFEKESESLIHFENSEIEIQQERIECTEEGSKWDGMGSISPQKSHLITNPNSESRLRRKLSHLQSQQKYRKKYELFYYLLEKHSKQRKHLNLFSVRRFMVLIMLVIGKRIDPNVVQFITDMAKISRVVLFYII